MTTRHDGDGETTRNRGIAFRVFALPILLVVGIAMVTACQSSDDSPPAEEPVSSSVEASETMQTAQEWVENLRNEPVCFGDELDDWGVLCCAASEGRVDVLEWMTSQGVDLATPSRHCDSESPLMSWAARAGQVEVMAWLSEQGQAVDARDNYGRTPLFWAVETNQLEAMAWLIEHGADINARDKNVRGDDADGQTPVFLAAQADRLDIMIWMHEHGADLHAMYSVSDDDDATLLSVTNDEEIRKWLNDHGVVQTQVTNEKRKFESWMRQWRLGMDEKDNLGRTLLHHAVDSASNRRLNAVEGLLALGADVNARNNNGATPLHDAAMFGHLDAARALVEHGADVSIRDNDDSTPLHWAASNGYLEIVKLLVEHGADVNVKRKGDWTPLYGAASRSNPDVATWLIEHGADVNAKDFVGQTPMYAAAKEGRIETMALLKDHGADVNVRGNKNRTPLSVAKDEKTKQWLRDNGARE